MTVSLFTPNFVMSANSPVQAKAAPVKPTPTIPANGYLVQGALIFCEVRTWNATEVCCKGGALGTSGASNICYLGRDPTIAADPSASISSYTGTTQGNPGYASSVLKVGDTCRIDLKVPAVTVQNKTDSKTPYSSPLASKFSCTRPGTPGYDGYICYIGEKVCVTR